MRDADEGDAGYLRRLFSRPHARAFLNDPGAAGIERFLEDPNVECSIVQTARGDRAGAFIIRNGGFLVEFSALATDPPGKGAGRFALEWGIRYAFTTCGAHRIALEIREDNATTRALCERLGFVQEGVFRDGFYDVRAGTYRNLVAYGMLAPRTAARRKVRGRLPSPTPSASGRDSRSPCGRTPDSRREAPQ
jgi:hypothetical protein